IGSGAAGTVRRANWRGTQFAVKELCLVGEDNMDLVMREIRQLSRMEHENIIKMHGWSVYDDLYAYLIMDYVEGGSLHDYIHSEAEMYSMEDAVRWASQCAKALEYMHSMQPNPVLHRDIKPQNLLLDSKRNLKICDFGCAADLSSYLSSMRGTAAYIAPEVCGYNVGNADTLTVTYKEKCDVYSFGITLWELMSRETPYCHLNFNGTRDMRYVPISAALKGDRPDMEMIRPDCWEGVKYLIHRCWEQDPADRPTMRQVVEYLGHLTATNDFKGYIHFLGDAVLRPLRRALVEMSEIIETARIIEREALRVGIQRETRRVTRQVEQEAKRFNRRAEREVRRVSNQVANEARR
ncbi:hypothetical protein KR018_008585, partial [Drosophila ironensis]